MKVLNTFLASVLNDFDINTSSAYFQVYAVHNVWMNILHPAFGDDCFMVDIVFMIGSVLGPLHSIAYK
jgi:hypothetical protein